MPRIKTTRKNQHQMSNQKISKFSVQVVSKCARFFLDSDGTFLKIDDRFEQAAGVPNYFSLTLEAGNLASSDLHLLCRYRALKNFDMAKFLDTAPRGAPNEEAAAADLINKGGKNLLLVLDNVCNAFSLDPLVVAVLFSPFFSLHKNYLAFRVSAAAKNKAIIVNNTEILFALWFDSFASKFFVLRQLLAATSVMLAPADVWASVILNCLSYRCAVARNFTGAARYYSLEIRSAICRNLASPASTHCLMPELSSTPLKPTFELNKWAFDLFNPRNNPIASAFEITFTGLVDKQCVPLPVVWNERFRRLQDAKINYSNEGVNFSQNTALTAGDLAIVPDSRLYVDTQNNEAHFHIVLKDRSPSASGGVKKQLGVQLVSSSSQQSSPAISLKPIMVLRYTAPFVSAIRYTVSTVAFPNFLSMPAWMARVQITDVGAPNSAAAVEAEIVSPVLENTRSTGFVQQDSFVSFRRVDLENKTLSDTATVGVVYDAGAQPFSKLFQKLIVYDGNLQTILYV